MDDKWIIQSPIHLCCVVVVDVVGGGGGGGGPRVLIYLNARQGLV